MPDPFLFYRLVPRIASLAPLTAQQPSFFPVAPPTSGGDYGLATGAIERPWVGPGPRPNCFSNPLFTWRWRVVWGDFPQTIAKIITGNPMRWSELPIALDPKTKALVSWYPGMILSIPNDWNRFIDEFGFPSGGMANKFWACVDDQGRPLLPSPLAPTGGIPPWPYGFVRRPPAMLAPIFPRKPIGSFGAY